VLVLAERHHDQHARAVQPVPHFRLGNQDDRVGNLLGARGGAGHCDQQRESCGEGFLDHGDTMVAAAGARAVSARKPRVTADTRRGAAMASWRYMRRALRARQHVRGPRHGGRVYSDAGVAARL
jgi:hypothetical protein